jgi:predicted ribosome quality control (RQC) complex YloA/Tae2 family protein
MKRLLRSHYRVKQRLERYGVDSLSDAVAHIAELRRQVRTYREQQREQALDRMEVLDDLMDAVDSMRHRLKARPASGSPNEDEEVPDAPSDNPLRNVDDLIDALEQALDEMRLELWLHQSYDEEGLVTPVASTAADLLDRLADEVDATAEVHDRLRTENERLSARNEALQRDVDRLEQTIEQKDARIEALEQKLERHASRAADA